MKAKTCKHRWTGIDCAKCVWAWKHNVQAVTLLMPELHTC